MSGVSDSLSAEALRAQKANLRKLAQRARDQAPRSPKSGAALAQNLEAAIRLPKKAILSGYWPIGSEMDVMPALISYAMRGGSVALPIVAKSGAPLVFRRWREGDQMDSGPFGIAEPKQSAEVLRPDVLLVPLLAFDRVGYRLGYGGGFYDRTLRELRALKPVLAIGVAFAAQETPETPRGSMDEKLDWVITEREAIEILRGDDPSEQGV